MLLRDFTSLNKHNKWTAVFLYLLLSPVTVKLNNVNHEFYVWLWIEEAWSNGFEKYLFTYVQKLASSRGNLIDDLMIDLPRSYSKALFNCINITENGSETRTYDAMELETNELS